MTENTDPPVMDLSSAGQRAYCAQLGIIPDGPDGFEAWWKDPVCRDVARLLDAMETQQRKMASAAGWVRSALDTADQRLAGEHVHTSGLNSSGEIARHAIEYDMAVAAYRALEDQLHQLVQRIRIARGYEVNAFSRLEDHPQLSPEEERARRQLAADVQHLAGWPRLTAAAKRRHLMHEHSVRPAGGASGSDLDELHAPLHPQALEALRRGPAGG